ncbi:hypothetical protein BN134_2609 [Cronobacter dublinensis 1210]|uniref:Uncharacterized protein n=1 Tax=Cronobacter dublinensis 1210 TaxID=1208656 RepID=A0ABP1WC70_9ENTR|nr:hypothetical protein BN134_2609 [Cronobacter dublinensis 1210]
MRSNGPQGEAASRRVILWHRPNLKSLLNEQAFCFPAFVRMRTSGP